MCDRRTFALLARTRKHRRGPLWVAVLAGASDEATPPRVAFAIGRRVGGAVVRNRLRRRLRASLVDHRARLYPGATYLFGASPPAAVMPYDELNVTVGELLKVGRP